MIEKRMKRIKLSILIISNKFYKKNLLDHFVKFKVYGQSIKNSIDYTTVHYINSLFEFVNSIYDRTFYVASSLCHINIPHSAGYSYESNRIILNMDVRVLSLINKKQISSTNF